MSASIRTALIGAVWAVAATGGSVEFLLVDAYETSSSPYRRLEASPFAGSDIPRDWTAPVDYANGTWHSRIVIHRMGDGAYPWPDVAFLITMRDGDGLEDAHPKWQDCLYPVEAIGSGRIMTYSHPVAGIWREHGFRFDTHPTQRFRVQPRFHVHDPDERFDLTIKDIGGHWRQAPGATSAQDVIDWIAPYEYSYQVVVVAAGHTFSGWDHYPMRGVEVCGIALRKLTPLPRIGAALEAGALGEALDLARRTVARTDDASERALANSVAERLLASLATRQAACQDRFDADPLRAAEDLAGLAAAFAGCDEGKTCRELGREWTRNDAYRDAAKAERRYRGAIAAAGTLLRELPADGPDAAFEAAHGETLAGLQRILADARERHPGSPACRELAARIERLEGTVPDGAR